MPDILFLPLDDLAGAPADAVAALSPTALSPTAADADAATAVRATHDGRTAALAGRWDAAAAALAASAAHRAALVAGGAAGPAVAVRGWSDVAALAAARGDAAVAADALARARAIGGEAGAGCALTQVALAEVAAWLDGLAHPAARTDAPWDAPWNAPVPFARTPECLAPGDAAQDVLAELTAECTTAPGVVPIVTAPAPVAPDAAWPEAEPADTEWADAEWADTEWAPWGPTAESTVTPGPPAPNDVSPPVEASGTHEATPGPELPWLELEAPLRPWERGSTPAGTGEAVAAAAAVGTVCTVPVAVAPLAPPLAPALRNSKIDEAVALATAAPAPRAGRLRSLVRRLTSA